MSMPSALPVTRGRARMKIRAARAYVGRQGAFSVDLVQSGGAAGIQNDIYWVDSPETPVAVGSDGKPDCTVNPALSGHFAFQPPGCQGGDCYGMRAMVMLPFGTAGSLSRGTLYTCNVTVDPNARPHIYRLYARNALASDPRGLPIRATCASGRVRVLRSP